MNNKLQENGNVTPCYLKTNTGSGQSLAFPASGKERKLYFFLPIIDRELFVYEVIKTYPLAE